MKDIKSNKNNLLTCYKETELENEIGIDEVGRGPMFGRVYIAAVILPKNNLNFDYSLLKDSKKFSSNKKIKEVSDYIKKNCISYSIQWSDEKEIDSKNIRIATFNAMHKALDEIVTSNKKYLILIDGNDFIPYIKINKDCMLESINYKCIEGGDNKFCSIAAASILAKVARDQYILDLCEKFPKLKDYYDLNNNKGYGTKKHIDGLEKYGVSIWHRKTFGKCATVFENNEFSL